MEVRWKWWSILVLKKGRWFRRNQNSRWSVEHAGPPSVLGMVGQELDATKSILKFQAKHFSTNPITKTTSWRSKASALGKMMKNLFGYIFYRISRAYFKYDGRKSYTAILGITLIQCVWLLAFIGLIARFFILPKDTKPYTSIIKTVGVVFFFLIVFINYKIYINKYNFYRSKYINEPSNQAKLHGLLIIISLILPWILIYYIANSNIGALWKWLPFFYRL